VKVERKLTKASVHYREATGKHNCGNCAMFHPRERGVPRGAGTCDLVRGIIHAGDLCDRWVAR